jgi:Uma2 family endonuclease
MAAATPVAAPSRLAALTTVSSSSDAAMDARININRGGAMRLVLELPDALPMTAEDFEALPAVEGVRLELWEGSLVVAAAAQRMWHSEVADRIKQYHRGHGRTATSEVGVVVGARGVPVPDVTVFRDGANIDVDRSQFPATDVACVVEVVSPESRDRDRSEKPSRYARAGIPEYWIVEQDDSSYEAVVEQHRLTPTPDGHTYTLIRRVTLSELEQE